jgi:hypothetical protein
METIPTAKGIREATAGRHGTSDVARDVDRLHVERIAFNCL